MKTPFQSIDSLTALRFFAALHVALYHLVSPEFSNNHAGLVAVLKSGAVAVNLFFVHSGFILAYRYGGSAVPLRGYFNARIARIYPVYLFSLAVSLPLYWPRSDWWTTLRSVFLFQAVTARHTSWNPVSWSLSVEAFFYVFFPFMLAFLALLNKRELLLAAGALWLISLLPAQLSHLGWWSEDAAMIYPLFRVPEFAFGMCLGLAFWRGAHLRQFWFYVATAAAVGVFCFSNYAPWVLGIGVLSPMYGVIMLAMASINQPTPTWLVLLGQASYSLYLLHPSLGYYWCELFGYSLGSRIAAVLFCVACSVLCFKVIESPARIWLRRGKQAVLVATA